MAPQPSSEPPLAPSGRPWKELFRLDADGSWRPPDGLPAEAFVGRDSHGFPFAVYSTRARYGYWKNPAMKECLRRWGCANGRQLRADGRYAS